MILGEKNPLNKFITAADFFFFFLFGKNRIY